MEDTAQEASQAKKLALLDGTSTQEAAELLPLVEDLVEEGSYHPIARVGHDMLSRPLLWVGRAMVPIGTTLAASVAMSLFGVPWYRVFEYSFLGFLWIALPVWSVTSVGAWMDRLAGRDPGGLVSQVTRRGRDLVQALVLAGPTAWVVFHGADVVATWVRTNLGWSYSAPTALACLVLGSMVWGFFATSLVVRGRGAPMALVEGVVESGALVVRTPLVWWRWLQKPSLRRLQAGEGMMLPYLLFLWVATGLAAIGAGWLFVTVGKALVGGPTDMLRLLMTGVVGLSAALAFEGAVGVGTLNYLALLVERSPTASSDPADAEPEGALELEASVSPGGTGAP